MPNISSWLVPKLSYKGPDSCIAVNGESSDFDLDLTMPNTCPSFFIYFKAITFYVVLNMGKNCLEILICLF